MAEEEAKGKSVVKLSEWKIEGTPGGTLQCVKYVTETIDGDPGAPKATRKVTVPRPDLTGTDLAPVLAVCQRFGFDPAGLIDECRRAEHNRIASSYRSRLISEDRAKGE